MTSQPTPASGDGSDTTAPSGYGQVKALSLKPGDKVDTFTIAETIATSGSATVYKAHDDLLDRFVAIKQIILSESDRDDEVRKRIRDEAAMHKRVSIAHPKHLIQFIDVVNDSRGMMLISEFYPSTSLEDMLQHSSNPLDERQALGIIAATAKGLSSIHHAGVIHRDLKPSNILLGNDGGLKICDFGLAAVVEAQDSLSLGSVRYMAPELLRSEPADPRVDLYSLGMIGYEILTGRAKFDAAFRTVLKDQRNQTMRWMKWHTNPRVNATPLSELNPHLPEHLTQLISRLMDKDLSRRVSSADDVVDAIRRHFTGESEPPALNTPPTGDGTATSQPGDTAPLPRRSKLPFILGGLLAFWLIVALGIMFVNQQQRQNEIDQREARATETIKESVGMYEAGDYQGALSGFDSVTAEWPAESRFANAALGYGLKTRGRIAFNDAQYQEAIDYFTKFQASDVGKMPGESQSVTTLIRDAQAAQAFQLGVDSIKAAVDTADFVEGRRLLDEFRGGQLTPAQHQRLDKLQTTLRDTEIRLKADARIVAAIEMFEAGKIEEAITELETLDSSDSLTETAKGLLVKWQAQHKLNQTLATATEAERTGDLAAAIAAYRELITLKPSDEYPAKIAGLESRLLTQEAAILFEDGNFPSAKIKLDQAIEKNTANQEARKMRDQITAASDRAKLVLEGDAAARENNFKLAIEKYQAAIAVKPDSGISEKLDSAEMNLLIQTAQSTIKAGNLSQARTALTGSLERWPGESKLTSMLAEVEKQISFNALVADGDKSLNQEDFGRAKRLYLQARELIENDLIAKRIEGVDYERSMSQVREFMTEGLNEAALALLKQAMRIKQTPEALKLLEQLAPGTDPEQPDDPAANE